MKTVAELTLGTEPDSVPRARRMVRAALVDALPDVAADAELVVSELVTNATLHGQPPIIVRVLVDGLVRLEVDDAGKSAPILLEQPADAMTGRGLAMVGAVTSTWGVEPLSGGGKRVWAEISLAGDSALRSVQPAIDVDELLAAWTDDDPATATYTVRLGTVSTELLLAAKAHIDNVVRELTLMREGESSGGAVVAPEMNALIETVTVDFAEARAEIKRQAAAAAARGEPVTDLELHLTPAAADAGERYLDALDTGDRYARAAHLLTLAPPPAHRVFRRWYVQSIVDQLRALARGGTPPEPTPFQVVLAEEVSRLAHLAADSDRLRVLQDVTRRLARAPSPEEMARAVVEGAVHALGVESAGVRLLVDGSALRVVARARADTPGSAILSDEPYPEYPIDADFPGAEAARTRRPVFVRSLVETLGADPRLAARYRPGQSGRVVPLVIGEETLGVLSLTFISGEMSGESEIALTEALADVLAQGLKRAELEARLAEVREMPAS